MTKCNTLSVNLYKSQLSKLKFCKQNRSEVSLNFSSNLIRNPNNETNLPHKILLTDTHKFQKFLQVLKMVHQII